MNPVDQKVPAKPEDEGADEGADDFMEFGSASAETKGDPVGRFFDGVAFGRFG